MSLIAPPSAQAPLHPSSRFARYGAAVALGSTALYVGLVDPASGGWFPSCPTRALTGAWCPMCGMTRAAHHLLHGDVVTAMRFNLFVVPVLAVVATLSVARMRRRGGRWVPGSQWPARAWIAAAVVLVAFGVLRNLAGLDVLRGAGA